MNVTDLPDRIANRIVVTDSGCWEWQGSHRRGTGHGFVHWRGSMRPVYRVTYELLVGPTDHAEDMDHLCRNPPCCNPDHVEPVTHAENMRRGIQSFAARTTCLSGRHDITQPGAIRLRGSARRPRCRECLNEYRRARRALRLTA